VLVIVSAHDGEAYAVWPHKSVATRVIEASKVQPG
jgi:hypothetical protein